MVCEKCGYLDKKEVIKNGRTLCTICNFLSPESLEDFNKYLEEKIDWKILETFRKYNQKIGKKQKEGMALKAQDGKIVTRPPFGYTLTDGELVQNEESSKVHSIFKIYSEGEISLNQLSKKNSLSVNGLKKILKNRTYLGEVKFDGQLHKGTHKPIISQELFYVVQRRLGS
ncbi:recombinase family protein [archaeon]|nr:recombinase family protein [archaeon]